MSAFKLIAGIVFQVTFYGLLLFVPAGTLHWWRAWVFLAITLVVTAVAVWRIARDNADLPSALRGSYKKDSRFGTGFSWSCWSPRMSDRSSLFR